MLPVEQIIGDSGLTVGPDGVRLDMRLPWYRSLPLSTVAVEGVTVDGEAIDLSAAKITVGDKTVSLAEAADEVDHFWFVLDSAFLSLPSVAAEPGAQHQVELTLKICPPYIPGMKRVNRQSENLTVGEAA